MLYGGLGLRRTRYCTQNFATLNIPVWQIFDARATRVAILCRICCTRAFIGSRSTEFQPLLAIQVPLLKPINDCRAGRKRTAFGGRPDSSLNFPFLMLVSDTGVQSAIRTEHITVNVLPGIRWGVRHRQYPCTARRKK
jgi:hypothetical protein